jgi:hypothetical protein
VIACQPKTLYNKKISCKRNGQPFIDRCNH